MIKHQCYKDYNYDDIGDKLGYKDEEQHVLLPEHDNVISEVHLFLSFEHFQICNCEEAISSATSVMMVVVVGAVISSQEAVWKVSPIRTSKL